MSEEKAGAVQWIQDGGGVTTCHVNDGRLNYKDSLIGTLLYLNDGWHVIIKDGNIDITPDGAPSLASARDAMVAHFNKSPKAEEVKTNRMTPRIAQAGKNWDEIKKHSQQK